MQAAVILPARDQRQGLARSLAALAAQTRPPERVVVLDQASADGTQDWLRVRWPKVELVRLAHARALPAAALDAALERVDSEVVAFLTPGDLWPRDALAAALAALERQPAVLLPVERAHGTAGQELSALACRTEALRVPARGEPTLLAELLARTGAPARLPAGPAVRLAPTGQPAPPLPPAAWGELLTAAHAGLPAGRDALLIGLDAADRPAGLLDLLGHALALTAAGRAVQAFTLADLEWRHLEEAAPATPLLLASTGGFGPAEAAFQLCFEDLVRRAGKRPVRLAIRRLAPSSLALAGRLIAAASGHPDLELWVADRVSHAYALPLLGQRARLLPPGIAGLAAVLQALGRRPELAATLPMPPGIPVEPRWRDLDAWYEGCERDAALRLGHVLARLAGVGNALRTPALQEAWSLVLPGWAALLASPDPLRTRLADAALFAALCGHGGELDPAAPGGEALLATWGHVLAPLGVRLAADTRPAA